MSIPKDKAKELVDKYYLSLTEFMENSSIDSRKHYSKQCAIIAVDELIKDTNASSPFEEQRLKYWQEVKNEIEKL